MAAAGVGGALLLALVMPMALRVIAVRALAGMLGAHVGIGAVTVQWADKAIEVTDVRVAQPAGYGGGDCLAVGRFYVRPAWSSLSRARLELTEIAIADAHLRLVNTPDGLNVAALFGTRKKGGSRQDARNAKGDGKQAGGGEKIVIDALSATNCTIIWTDRAVPGDKPLRIETFDLVCAGTNLRFGAFPDNDPGRLTATGRIRQSAGSNAFTGVAVVTAPLDNGISAINSVLRIVGLELATLRPILPSGAAQALGAQALDFDADISLDARTLNARLAARPANAAPLSLTICGTPDRPVVDGSGILLNMFLRAGGGVGGLARGIAGVGVDAAGAALTTVQDVGRAAGGLAMDVGGGLLQTARGVAGGNLSEVAGGLHQTTVGAAGQAAAGLRDAGAATLSDAVDAVTPSVAQKRALEQWRIQAPLRWGAGWTEAVEKVDKL